MSPEECIDKLEQLIIDENELVNYKMLSKELKIHVNEAKKHLYNFLKIQNSKKEVKLHAYFFLSGFVLKNDMKTRKLLIVSEDNLEKVKEEFEEITSCHIYSLNKGAHKDDSLLLNSQSWCKKLAEEHREYSAIKHPNIVMQAPVIKKIEVAKNIKPLPSKTSVNKQTNPEVTSSLFKNEKKDAKKAASPADEKSNEKNSKTSDNKDDQTPTVSTAKPEPSEKKSALSSMWQKLEDKSKNGKCESSKTETKGKKGAAKSVGKNNIMSMFSKQAEKNANNPPKKMDTSPVKQISSPVEKTSNNISPKRNDSNESKKVTVKSTRKSSQRKTKRTSKQTSDNESEEECKPKKKKHRRICTMDDSDSDSETEEAQDRAQRSLLASDEPADTAMPVSDEEPIPPTPPVVFNKGKKKVWKTVQKTFQDEDGFLVAKQEKVLVSASESDEDPIPSKNKSPKKEPKENSFTYRKQASLTSFFKQK